MHNTGNCVKHTAKADKLLSIHRKHNTEKFKQRRFVLVYGREFLISPTIVIRINTAK